MDGGEERWSGEGVVVTTKPEPTPKECHGVSENVNYAIELASLSVDYMKTWRKLCAQEGKKRRFIYKLRDARSSLKQSLARVRAEIGSCTPQHGNEHLFPMWMILDRKSEKDDWAYFNVLPTEKQAVKQAAVVATTRFATIVRILVPVPRKAAL